MYWCHVSKVHFYIYNTKYYIYWSPKKPHRLEMNINIQEIQIKKNTKFKQIVKMQASKSAFKKSRPRGKKES